MAQLFEHIMQSINNSELRIAIEKLFEIIGVGKGDSAGSASITGDITGDVTGNVTGNVTGDVTGDLTGGVTSNVLQSAEHGAGAIGTAFAPRTYRRSDNDEIITEIHVDLTGLACKGDAADDVIGLAAGGAAYIGQHTEALNGVVYKAEISTLETPTEETATITTDINVTMNSSGTLEYDGAASNSYLFNTGGLTAGNTVQNLVPALTDEDYIYLTEGDTAATTGEYSGGQIVITLYGRALLS